MKPINIKNFHKIPLLMNLLLLIAVPLCICFLTTGIMYKITELIVIAAIFLVALVIGIGFFLNYGIRITSKRVTLMNQRMLKVFRYDDVIYIKIVFDNDTISGEIKTENQKAYEFYFDGIDLSTGSSFFAHLWVTGLKLTKNFVDKSISDLLVCEKVKVQNSFTGR